MTDQAQETPRIGGKIRLLPSLLSADFARLGESAKKALDAGAHGLHADVMDGRFVPPITFGPAVIAALIRETNAWVDAHLMIEEPEKQIEAFAKSGVKAITVHAEACKHLHRVLAEIRAAGCEAGVAFNPATPVGPVLDYVAPLLDRVLIMSVDPGWGGQSFITETLDKISEVRDKLDLLGSDAEVQVDGGVNAANIADLVFKGATEIVAGTAVFKGDIAANIAALSAEAEKPLLM